MEKTYKTIAFFFVFIIALIICELYRVYIKVFPVFTSVVVIRYFYSAMVLAWITLSIIQILLIKYQKEELHKKLGKVSYVLAPFLLLSLFFIAKDNFINLALILPKKPNIAVLALSVTPLCAFATLYILAMVNKKNTAYHIRYIAGSVLVLIAPAIGKAFIIYGGMPFRQGFTYSMYITEIITVLLVVYDIIEANPLKPYLVTLSVLFAVDIMSLFQFPI
ncbi:MAG: hypothetical protein WDM90_14420 [Ferruginibacter sp.]